MIDLIDSKISSYFIKLKNLNESKRHMKAKFVSQNTYESLASLSLNYNY